MVRHPRKDLRLVRLVHIDRTDRIERGGPFPNECNCQLPMCSWTPKKQQAARRGYQEHVGAWRSVDGRFTLIWEGQHSYRSGSHPDGWLRVEDALLRCVDYRASIREARELMAERYRKLPAEFVDRRKLRYSKLRTEKSNSQKSKTKNQTGGGKR